MNTSKITRIIIIALILLSAAALHLQAKPANAVPTQPAIYCIPDTYSSTFPVPLTTHPRWNFSIYIEGVPDVFDVSVWMNSSDCTKARIISYFGGFLATQAGWTAATATSFDNTTTGYLEELNTYTSGASYDATNPTEVFIVEVELESFVPYVSINITDSYVGGSAGDYIGGASSIPGAQPIGHAVFMTAISTSTITFGGQDYNITTTSNSTVSAMTFDQPGKGLNFTTSGPDGTDGFVNVTIPTALLSASLTDWQVLIDNSVGSPVISQNATHTSIYLNYSQNTHEIRIIGTWVVPEFPSTTILLTLLATTAISLALIRKIHKKRWQTL